MNYLFKIIIYIYKHEPKTYSFGLIIIGTDYFKGIGNVLIYKMDKNTNFPSNIHYRYSFTIRIVK